MKKIIILVLLLTTQISQSGFWTHIWNNTGKNINVYALERNNKMVKGHWPATILAPLNPFKTSVSLIPNQKGYTIGFFENDIYYNIFYDHLPKNVGKYTPSFYLKIKPFQENIQTRTLIINTYSTPKNKKYIILKKNPLNRAYSIIGNRIDSLIIEFNNKKYRIKEPSTYHFKNKYLEIQKTKNNKIKVRWYFRQNKGPWKTISNLPDDYFWR